MSPRSFILRDANVLDEGGGFSGRLDVLVEDGLVAAVDDGLPGGEPPSVDCADLWLVPGIFDCHDHLTMSSLDLAECLARPVSAWALEAARNARLTLEAGVTFVRDLAGADAGIREAFARGDVPGPTLLATTGGLVSEHDDPFAPELSAEEIEVAVFEASGRSKPVAAHAYGGEGIDNAVAAGVRSIEHGGFLTEEQAARMSEAGCWLVPTLSAMRDCLRWAEAGALTPAQSRKVLGLGLELGACVRVAKEAGVRLAVGTDSISREQHGRNLEEVLLMREAGLTPEEALLAATVGGAELCGVADRYGRIAPGYVFDAVLLDEDPGDLAAFGEPGAVTGVFKGGEPALAHPRVREAGLATVGPA